MRMLIEIIIAKPLTYFWHSVVPNSLHSTKVNFNMNLLKLNICFPFIKLLGMYKLATFLYTVARLITFCSCRFNPATSNLDRYYDFLIFSLCSLNTTLIMLFIYNVYFYYRSIKILVFNNCLLLYPSLSLSNTLSSTNDANKSYTVILVHRTWVVIVLSMST